MKTIKTAFFSPTGTTETVVQEIAKSINPASVETIDLTKPEARRKPLEVMADDLLIVGVPVYMGRVPALLSEWFDGLKAHATPMVCVVVYGNRVYDNALLELKDILKGRGGIIIAGGAYIGEHSFSNFETPSRGRPDEDDLSHARAFGERIRKKIQSTSAGTKISEVEVPGTYPYKGVTDLWDVDFIAINDNCTQCGTCAKICPMGAISPHDSSEVDIFKCITCCACLKRCPQSAREMTASPVKEAQKRVNTLFRERKKPESFV